MRDEDAKNKATTPGRSESRLQGFEFPLGELQADGSDDGTRQVGTSTEDCLWRDFTGEYESNRSGDIKKILERLDALEARHLAYVRAHKMRLQARFQEDITEEEEFLKESSQLRTDIYQLAASRD